MKQNLIVGPQLFSISINTFSDGSGSKVSFVVNGYRRNFYTTKFKVIQDQWHYLKVDHRYSGSKCIITIYADHVEIHTTTDACRSFDGSEATVYANCVNCLYGWSPAGKVDSFRFVWL